MSFYAGTVTVTDPATGTAFGPVKETVVKRTIDAVAATITEEVLDGQATIVTTMTRQGETNVFAASDGDATFEGTLTFEGTPFHFTGWSYALSMTDGSGTIEGTATIDADGIATDKLFRDPSGAPQARIQDALATVDEETYDSEHQRLAP